MEQFDVSKANYIKSERVHSFTCARCNRQKTAKKYAELIIDGKTVQICNGCYGNLLSAQGESQSADHSQSTFPVVENDITQKKGTLAAFTEKEILTICRMITAKEIRAYFQKYPKEFAKIKPGFRASSLSDDDAVTLACKNMTRSFVSTFVKKWIDIWLMQIQNACSDWERSGVSSEEALLRTLPESVFSENIDLFFKATDKDYSVEYIALAKAALVLFEGSSQADYSKYESELSSIKKTNIELLETVAELRLEIESEKVSHEEANKRLVETTTTKNVLQKDLEAASATILSLTEKKKSMQAELDNFYQLSNFADTESADTYSDEYEFTSLCQVVWGYQDKPWLSRLADIKDGEISYFKKKENEPYYFSNRDRLFWTNGPNEDGSLGVWQWNSVPNKADSSTDYVTTSYNNMAKIIEIIELAECHTYEDMARVLVTESFKTTPGNKILFTCQNTDGQMISLLCLDRDFDRNNGEAKLKSTVYTLPMFEISAADILTIAGKKIYKFVSLGLPQGVFRTRNPLSVVKEIIIKRATNAVLRQKGLSKKEAQHCQSFLKELPVKSLHQEIVDAYSCTETEAREYIATFISQSDTYLSESDIDLGTLAAALERNSTFVEKCKDLLASDWETENAKKLREAQQQLDDIEKETASRRMEIATFEANYLSLQNKMEKTQADIDAQVKLANDVELKVAQRISAAKKNAADFICEMAFSTASSAVENHLITANSVLPQIITRREINCVQGEDILDIDSYIDELAENLNRIGYNDIAAAKMAQMIAFCIESRLPIICSTNTYKIADCIAAMFGNHGALTATLSINQSDCASICESIQQEATDKVCVVVINGVFDGFNLNTFNEILLRFETRKNNVLLIFPLNGIDTMMIPSYVWNQTMFIDGDLGLDGFESNSIIAHTTTAEFDFECTAEDIILKKKDLKPLSGLVSNTAMLIYAKYMSITNSTLKNDNQVLMHIVLHALSSARKEQLLQVLSSMSIDIESDKEISRYL